MNKLMLALQQAVNTYHPMRRPNTQGWMYAGLFELNGVTYAYASDTWWGKPDSRGGRQSKGMLITCRGVQKQGNDANMHANHWFELAYGEGEDNNLYVKSLPDNWQNQ